MLPGGATIAGELAARRLLLLDLDALEGFAGPYGVDGDTRHFRVPFALFHVRDGSPLPVAIQLDRAAGSAVYTPDEPNPNDWMMARLFVSNCHFIIHQFRSHALVCHFMQEPLSVGTRKCLPASHPVYKLLRPHFDGLISINNSARGSLVMVEDYNSFARLAGDLFAMGAHGNAASAIRFYETMEFRDFFFENRLRNNGVWGEDVIADYPYRDDGRLVMAAITNYVGSIINFYYQNDAAVEKDRHLQTWALDLSRQGKVRHSGLETMHGIESLIHFLSNVIFIASAFHAAVNFNQVAIAGNTANIPGSLYRPPPEEKGTLGEEDLVQYLQPNGIAQRQIGLMGILSTQSGDRLGYFRERLFVEVEALRIQDAVRPILRETTVLHVRVSLGVLVFNLIFFLRYRQFQEELAEVENTIVERNKTRKEAYKSFLPSRIPNSTAI